MKNGNCLSVIKHGLFKQKHDKPVYELEEGGNKIDYGAIDKDEEPVSAVSCWKNFCENTGKVTLALLACVGCLFCLPCVLVGLAFSLCCDDDSRKGLLACFVGLVCLGAIALGIYGAIVGLEELPEINCTGSPTGC